MSFERTDYVSLNRGGTPGTAGGDTGDYHVETIQQLEHLIGVPLKSDFSGAVPAPGAGGPHSYIDDSVSPAVLYIWSPGLATFVSIKDVVLGATPTKVATFAGDIDVSGTIDPTRILFSNLAGVDSPTYDPSANGNAYRIEFIEGGDLNFKSDATADILHLKNNGDVGVLTANPAATLDVVGSVRARESSNKWITGGRGIDMICDSGKSFIESYDHDTFVPLPLSVYSSTMLLQTTDTTPITFATENLVRATIFADGSFGFGTITPGALFDIMKSPNNTYAGDFFRVGWTDGTTTRTDLVVSNDGNVSIGTTDIDARLTVSSLGDDIPPLALQTNGTAGNYTTTNSAIIVRDANDVEQGRLFFSDPDVDNNAGAGNIFLGPQAGENATATDPAYNIGIGAKTMPNIGAAFGNVALGVYALGSITSGSSNIAVGTFSQQFATTASSNVAIGESTLNLCIDGVRNTAVGTGAMVFGESDTGNVAIGAGALVGDGIGVAVRSEHVAIGQDVAQTVYGGAGSVAIGAFALASGQEPTDVVAIGRYAAIGVSPHSLSGTVAIGSSAGVSVEPGADHNTLVGYSAGSSIANGARNIVIGSYPSGPNNVSTGSNNILIGHDISFGTNPTADDQLNIGNLIFATGLGEGSTLSSGSVSIGAATATAGYTLDVIGDLRCQALTQYSDENLKTKVSGLREIARPFLREIFKRDGDMLFQWKGRDAVTVKKKVRRRKMVPGGKVTVVERDVSFRGKLMKVKAETPILVPATDKLAKKRPDGKIDTIDVPIFEEVEELVTLRGAVAAGKRTHAGLSAQVVKASADALGFDFGGFKDASIKGGEGLGLDYSQFVPLLLVAIAQLEDEVAALKGAAPAKKAATKKKATQ